MWASEPMVNSAQAANIRQLRSIRILEMIEIRIFIATNALDGGFGVGRWEMEDAVLSSPQKRSHLYSSGVFCIRKLKLGQLFRRLRGVFHEWNFSVVWVVVPQLVVDDLVLRSLDQLASHIGEGLGVLA